MRSARTLWRSRRCPTRRVQDTRSRSSSSKRHPTGTCSTSRTRRMDPTSDPRGLAVLSQTPMVRTWASWGEAAPLHNNFAELVHVDLGGRTLGLTNVHLD